MHSATDTFYQWPEYQKIIGGYFDQHPWHHAVVVEVAERDDPLVAFLGQTIADGPRSELASPLLLGDRGQASAYLPASPSSGFLGSECL